MSSCTIEKSNILVSSPLSSRIKEQHNSIFVEAAYAGGEQSHQKTKYESQTVTNRALDKMNMEHITSVPQILS